MKNNLYKYIEISLPVLISLLSIFLYEFLGYLVIIYYFLREYYDLGNRITKKYTFFYLYFPLLFYSLRFIFGLSESFNNMLYKIGQFSYMQSARFLDLQHLLVELNCNKEGKSLTYIYNFNENMINSCPYTNHYGPLSNIFYINNNNIWLLTLLTAFFVMLSIFFIYFKSFSDYKEHRDLLFFLSISPPLNFLMERMNVDIIIYLICFWILKSQKHIYIKIIILLILSLYKLHPLFLLLGFVIYFFIKKDIKLFIFSLISFVTSSILIYDYLFRGDNYLASIPSEFTWSYGLLSDAIALSRLFELSNIYFSYSLLVLLVIFLSFYFQKINKISLYADSLMLFSVSFWFLGTSLFANYDYRIPLIFIVFTELFKLDIKLLKFSFIIFVFSSPPPTLSANFGSYESVQENIFYLDLSFYFLISYLLILVIGTLYNKFWNANL
jgi:hypothetical protein